MYVIESGVSVFIYWYVYSWICVLCFILPFVVHYMLLCNPHCVYFIEIAGMYVLYIHVASICSTLIVLYGLLLSWRKHCMVLLILDSYAKPLLMILTKTLCTFYCPHPCRHPEHLYFCPLYIYIAKINTRSWLLLSSEFSANAVAIFKDVTCTV